MNRGTLSVPGTRETLFAAILFLDLKLCPFASFANFTKSTRSCPPFVFCLFNLLSDGPPLAPGERDVTYRLETNDSDLRKEQPDLNEPRQLFPRQAVDPDAALVEQLRRQDAEAPEALVAAYWERAYRLAIRITDNASDAEEVVQDALWTVSRKIDSFQGVAAFGSWLYRITANTAYQKLRGRRTRKEVPWDDLAPPFDDRGRHVEAAGDWSRRLHDPAIESELRSVLSAAINELPAVYRIVFLLHDVEGLSKPEIAEALHLKLSGIKSRVHRARLFLRKRLADYMGRAMGADVMA